MTQFRQRLVSHKVSLLSMFLHVFTWEIHPADKTRRLKCIVYETSKTYYEILTLYERVE